MRVKSECKSKDKKKRTQSARSAQSAQSARSAVCSLHGLRFGVTGHGRLKESVVVVQCFYVQ